MTAATWRWPSGGDTAHPIEAGASDHSVRGYQGTGTSLRDALVAIGGLLAALVLVELAVPTTSPVSAASILDGIAVAAFTVAGLIAWHRRPHNRTGRLLVVAAVALWAAGMSDDEVQALRTIGQLLESLPLAVLLHLLLAFPSGRLDSRAARITAATAYLVALVLQLPQYLVTSPEVATTIWNVQGALGLCTMAATFVLAGRRLSTAPPVMRRQLGPFIGYGCVAITVLSVGIAILHTDPDSAITGWVILIQVATVAALPVAFVVGMLAGAFGRAGEVQEVAWGISEASADPALLDELMIRALGDRTARVFWAADRDDHRFVDSDGTPRKEQPGRGWWPIRADGQAVGGLGYDRTLIADTGLVGSVAGPLALAITNRRLVVDLRSAVHQLDAAAEQVRTSRRRIVVAADAERRRIARDLHDGAQQRIVLIGIEAQRMGRRAEHPAQVRSIAERVTEQLQLLLDELRSLVHGIMPATLQERGLPAGVAALADQMPVPVRVQVNGTLDRMPAEVESTGYFVVAEALTNATKHASAQQISVVLAAHDGRLEITVTDDGTGTQPTGPGFGLRSLQDRVAALDGTVTLQSIPHQGTTLRAEFACE